MNIKNKPVFYAVGLVLAVITFVPPMPEALRYILSLIPILAFGADVTLLYMEEFFKKNYINRYLFAVIATLGLLVNAKPAYAAITVIFASAASYFFTSVLEKANDRINGASAITTRYAKVIAEGRVMRTPVKSVAAGQLLLVEAGDIIPCDAIVAGGEIHIDYTNVYGASSVKTAGAGASCLSGGIVQSGSARIMAQKPASASLSAALTRATKKAHTPSPRQKQILGFARLLELAMAAVAILVFIILIIATGSFSLAVNISTVIMLASSTLCITGTLPALTHNTVLSARKRGVLFADMRAVEKCSEIQTVSPNEPISDNAYIKIEETGVIPAKGGNTVLDGVIYRDKQALEADPNPSFKLALGFESAKADAFALDPKPERIAGAVRSARNYKTILTQNLLCALVSKLTLLALVFLLNITPAAAIAIDFATCMICLFNATRE